MAREKLPPISLDQDWAIYWTLGNFSKPLAAINLPKSPTFLGNFCKGVKFFLWNHFWGTFIAIWRFLTCHTDAWFLTEQTNLVVSKSDAATMSFSDLSANSIDFQISSDSALSEVSRSLSFNFRFSSSSRTLFWTSVSDWNKIKPVW